MIGLDGQRTGGDARNNPGHDRQRQAAHLIVLQANLLQKADCTGVLFRQYDTDHDHHNAKPHHHAAAKPAGIDQRVAPVMLNDDRSDNQRQGDRGTDTEPRRGKPPLNTAQRQYAAQQRHTGCQQDKGDEVHLFKGFDAIARWQFHQQYPAQRNQRQTEFKQIETAPLVELQQFRRE